MSDTKQAIMWVYDDGGRNAAGFRGVTGDCATRAAAIAAGEDYKWIYARINELGKRERRGSRKSGTSNARTGVYRSTMKWLMEELGATWTPTMKIGSGCQVHLRMDELPQTGRLVLSLSKHYAAVIDGVLHDLSDCSREGSRCVYGFWTLPEPLEDD